MSIYRHPRLPDSAVVRLLAGLDRRGGAEACWPWTLGLAKGYGLLEWRTDTGKRQCAMTHRLAWELQHGRLVPAGLGILHRCDNARCGNPRHLYAGTREQNTADAIARDRYVRGVRHHKARITPEVAALVRALGLAGAPDLAIATALEIPATTVRGVTSGRTWRWVAAAADLGRYASLLP